MTSSVFIAAWGEDYWPGTRELPLRSFRAAEDVARRRAAALGLTLVEALPGGAYDGPMPGAEELVYGTRVRRAWVWAVWTRRAVRSAVALWAYRNRRLIEAWASGGKRGRKRRA